MKHSASLAQQREPHFDKLVTRLSALRGRNPLTGRGYEIVSLNVATSSCPVASGNVFGGQ
jgi:hypothetical protein